MPHLCWNLSTHIDSYYIYSSPELPYVHDQLHGNTRAYCVLLQQNFCATESTISTPTWSSHGTWCVASTLLLVVLLHKQIQNFLKQNSSITSWGIDLVLPDSLDNFIYMYTLTYAYTHTHACIWHASITTHIYYKA